LAAAHEYGEGVALVLVLILGALAGFTIGRWWALGLGLVAGCAAVAVNALSGSGLNDSPAAFLAIAVAASAALGVTLRRRLLPPSAQDHQTP
jgi:hypothetical protein